MKSEPFPTARTRTRIMKRGWCLVPLLLVCAGCDEEPRVRADNERPFLQLWVPSRSERLPYTTTFRWTGWDRDGVIDHYEYAVDVPDSVSLDRINDPLDESVAWEGTTATEMRFVFTTPEADTAVENGQV